MAKSKQQIAKEEQGYIPKFIPRNCSTCRYFKSEMKTEKGYYGDWIKEVDLRCTFGGFAVKKQGVCNKYQFKEDMMDKKHG